MFSYICAKYDDMSTILDAGTFEPLEHNGKAIITSEYIGWRDYDMIDHIFTGRDAEGKRVWGGFIQDDDQHDHLLWYWYLRLSEDQHKDFLLDRFSIRTMLLEATEVWAVCQDFNNKPRAVYTTTLFPAEYLPNEDTFFNSLANY